MIKTSTLICALAIFTKLALADQTWIGCTSPSKPPAIIDWFESTPQGCAQHCSQSPYNTPYAYFKPDGPNENCGCSDVGPTADDYRLAEDDVGTAATSCSADYYNTWISMTTFSMTGCYGNFNDVDGSTGDTQVASIVDCFNSCRGASKAFFRTHLGAFQCFCSSDQITFYSQQSRCESGLFTYEHTPGAYFPENSAYTKRQLKARLMQAKLDAASKLCPGDLTACALDGREGYECIDVDNELESCGGCIHGKYTVNSPTVPIPDIAVNCETIPGIRRGGSTCYKGRCESWICKKGWMLAANQTCVPL